MLNNNFNNINNTKSVNSLMYSTNATYMNYSQDTIAIDAANKRKSQDVLMKNNNMVN